MTLSTFFIETPSTSTYPTIMSSRLRGDDFSNAGETTKSYKEPTEGDMILEQNATRHYEDNGAIRRWVTN
jgi:hypothetical protein